MNHDQFIAFTCRWLNNPPGFGMFNYSTGTLFVTFSGPAFADEYVKEYIAAAKEVLPGWCVLTVIWYPPDRADADTVWRLGDQEKFLDYLARMPEAKKYGFTYE